MKRFLCVLIAAVMVFVPMNGLTAENWQTAFANHLRTRDFGCYFAIHDMNADGVPELFIRAGEAEWIYSFRNNTVLQIDGFTLRYHRGLFIPPNNTVGLIEKFSLWDWDGGGGSRGDSFSFITLTDGMLHWAEDDISWDDARVQNATPLDYHPITPANITAHIYGGQTAQTQATAELPPPTVTINGTPQSFEVPPQIVNDRTMLPLRAIGEALGMTVDFDDATNAAILTTPDTIITHVIRTAEISVNGATQTFDMPSMIAENRTLVPVRMLAEAVGAVVEWEPYTRTVVITTN